MSPSLPRGYRRGTPCQASDKPPPDDLIHRVVAPDILTGEQQLVARVE
jgi:hypothetical protein